MVFGAQTDKILVNKRKFGKEFHGFDVMHMSGFHSPSIPSALAASVTVAAQDLHALAMFRMIPPRIVVVKLHRQNKKVALTQHFRCNQGHLGTNGRILTL